MNPTQGPRPEAGTRSNQQNTYIEGTPGLEHRDQVLKALRANGYEPETHSANGWYWFISPCPNHDNAAVRISSGRDVEFHCTAGGQIERCDSDSLIHAFGLSHLIETESSMLDRLRAALVDSAGLDSIEPPSPLIDGILQLDSIAWLQGKPGHGKSFISLDMAGCVGTGNVWQGCSTKQGQVLYLAAEGVSGVRQRVRAWEHSMGEPMANVQFLPVAVQSTSEPAWSALVQLAGELKPTMIILDTQARITVGAEENSARDMGQFVHRVEQVRQATGACVLVVHHEGRAGEHMRGSTATEGAATSIIRASKSEDLITVQCIKQKDTPDFEEFRLRLVPTGDSAILALTGPSTSDQVSSILKSRWLSMWWTVHESEPVSVSVLVKSEVVPEATFHRHKKTLVNAGIVLKEGTGNQTRYRLLRNPQQ